MRKRVEGLKKSQPNRTKETGGGESIKDEERKPTSSSALAQPNNAHLQSPHSPNPNLELLALWEPLDIVELDAFPPASTRRLAPEEQQLLGHPHRIAAHVVAPDVRPQPRQRQAANDRLVGLSGTMSPSVVVIEAAVASVSTSIKLVSQEIYSPSSQHFDKMRLRRSWLVATLKSAEDAVLLQERLGRGPLHLHHLVLLNVALGRDCVKVKVLPQDDDTGPLVAVVA